MLIPKIAEAEIVQDADVFNDITVFERSDMVIASRQKNSTTICKNNY